MTAYLAEGLGPKLTLWSAFDLFAVALCRVQLLNVRRTSVRKARVDPLQHLPRLRIQEAAHQGQFHHRHVAKRKRFPEADSVCHPTPTLRSATRKPRSSTAASRSHPNYYYTIHFSTILRRLILSRCMYSVSHVSPVFACCFSPRHSCLLRYLL